MRTGIIRYVPALAALFAGVVMLWAATPESSAAPPTARTHVTAGNWAPVVV